MQTNGKRIRTKGHIAGGAPETAPCPGRSPHGSLGPPESTSQMASRLGQQFYHSSELCQTDNTHRHTHTHTDHRTSATVGHICTLRMRSHPTIYIFMSISKVVTSEAAKTDKRDLLWAYDSGHLSPRKMLGCVEITVPSPCHTNHWHTGHRHHTDQLIDPPVPSGLPAISHQSRELVVWPSSPCHHHTPSPRNCRHREVLSTCPPAHQDLWKISATKVCH